MNGFELSLYEIDGALRDLIPDLKRRQCTPRVMQEADALLDMRNELVFLIGSSAMEELINGNS